MPVASTIRWGCTSSLALGALIPPLGLFLLARRRRRSTDSASAARFSQRVTAWMPVVTAAFVCYELAFAPLFERVRVTLATGSLDGGAGRLSFALLPVVQGGILLAGLGITLAVLWNLRQRSGSLAPSGPEWRAPSRANT
jgi:hypothetical protein